MQPEGTGMVRANDAERARFRRPLGLLIIAYKAALGLTKVIVGVLLAVPGVDPQAIFARLSAEELREDPGDHFVAMVTRQLPSLVTIAGRSPSGLILLGLAKLLAAGAMWEGKEWGGYLLAVTVALLLPLDLRQALLFPTAGHVLLAAANVAVLVVLVLLLRGWLPSGPAVGLPAEGGRRPASGRP